jgi:hypothetical protein
MRTLLILFALFLVATPARAQVDVDYDRPPATEGELFSKSVVVLRGRVEARTLETAAGPITSIYTVRVLELLKGPGQAGGIIEVHRNGGLDTKEVERGFPPFEVNEEVVLFLQRSNNGWYWPLSGPDGAFKLTKEGHAHAYGRSGEVSKRHQGRPVAEFLAELRKHEK